MSQFGNHPLVCKFVAVIEEAMAWDPPLLYQLAKRAHHHNLVRVVIDAPAQYFATVDVLKGNDLRAVHCAVGPPDKYIDLVAG